MDVFLPDGLLDYVRGIALQNAAVHENLPIGADIPETSRVIVPSDKTGVVVAFNARADGRSALIHFVDAQHRPLEAGLAGKMEASGAEFIVGYDGEVYLTDLADVNIVMIELADGVQCRAQFDFHKTPAEQQLISGVACQ